MGESTRVVGGVCARCGCRRYRFRRVLALSTRDKYVPHANQMVDGRTAVGGAPIVVGDVP